VQRLSAAPPIPSGRPQWLVHRAAWSTDHSASNFGRVMRGRSPRFALRIWWAISVGGLRSSCDATERAAGAGGLAGGTATGPDERQPPLRGPPSAREDSRVHMQTQYVWCLPSVCLCRLRCPGWFLSIECCTAVVVACLVCFVDADPTSYRMPRTPRRRARRLQSAAPRQMKAPKADRQAPCHHAMPCPAMDAILVDMPATHRSLRACGSGSTRK
jgi:hypothetical protein